MEEIGVWWVCNHDARAQWVLTGRPGGVTHMRRSLVAAALAAAVGAAIVTQEARTAPLERPVSAHAARPGPPVMPDAAAIGSLRVVARIGAQQARTMRAAVRRCRAEPRPGRCALVALEHAAAGAKLSAVVLRAVTARVPAGRCADIAARLRGLVSAIAYIAVDGVRSASWPGYTWGAALASARVGVRVIALHEGRWPRSCARGVVGLRA